MAKPQAIPQQPAQDEGFAGTASAAAAPVSVFVCLCTARRPEMLRRCLGSLIAQKVDQARIAFQIIVVDNNPSGDAAPIVLSAATASGFPIHYVHEPRPGIPMARNAALEAALKFGADWIAFIDDDEFAPEDWLATLFATAEAYGADVLHGHVERLYPEKLPFWARTVSRHEQKRHEGEIRPKAATDNVMFRAAFVSGEKGRVRFDEALRYSGGSDTDFFIALRKAGAKIVFSFRPRIFEEILPSRLSFRSQTLRSYRIAAGDFRRIRTDRGALHLLWRYGPRTLGRLIVGLVCLVLSGPLYLVRPELFKAVFLRGVKSMLLMAALASSLLRVYPQPYRRIIGY